MITSQRLWLVPVLLLLVLAAPLGAATIYVPDDYAAIQGAINAASGGDVVRVRAGTYQETIDFLGKLITVNSLEGSAATIIDANAMGPAVTFSSGEGPGAVLQGFTLTNGTGYFDEVELRTFGGGIYCAGSSPTITSCRVENNAADIGGGICCDDAAPVISGCVVHGNTADNGAGLFIRGADPRVSNCSFTSNIALYVGGGIHCAEASPTITGCSIILNETTSGSVGGGGGISLSDASPMISNNSLRQNVTPMHGGAIRCAADSGTSEPVITGNFLKDNAALNGGAISCEDNGLVLIAGNRFVANEADTNGGGIYSVNSDTVLRDNSFVGNVAGQVGGGAYCAGPSSPGTVVEITRTVFEENDALQGAGLYTANGELRLTGCRISGGVGQFGGGVKVENHDGGLVADNIIHGNQATRGGGMLIHGAGDLVLERNTFVGNEADFGGAVYSIEGSALTVAHSIFWGNTSPQGPACYLDYGDLGLSLDINYSDVDGGIGALVVETGCTLNWGEGMIDADPLFAAGPAGDHYLSQTAAGQGANSPCVNAGDPAAGGAPGSTRTDAFSDRGAADIGAHYAGGTLLAGPGPAEANPPVVRLFPLQPDVAHELEFPAYGADSYGVNVHAGDLDGDGIDEIITGAGPGEVYGPHVRAFRSNGQAFPGVSFFAYGTLKYGVNAAAGDLDGDGAEEIVTGAGPGAVFGPHVRAFRYSASPAGTTPISGVSFFAYGTLKYGVNVAAGDVDGDGFDEIITGAGPGAVFGPHVRGWNVDGGTAAAIPGLSYLAYGTPRFGVRVSCGDLDGDGIDEIVTAPGPSQTFGAHIRGWNVDGGAVAQLPGCSFFALPSGEYAAGAQLFAGADLDGDGLAEMVVGAGPDAGADSAVAVYRYEGAAPSLWFSLTAMPASWRHGATVAAGNF